MIRLFSTSWSINEPFSTTTSPIKEYERKTHLGCEYSVKTPPTMPPMKPPTAEDAH
jgi:hypothetical protein